MEDFSQNFVNLHRNGSRRKVRIELLDGAPAESRLFEFVGAEGSTESRTAPCAVDDLEHLAALRFQSREGGITIVYQADVKNAQVEALEESPKSRVVLVKMHVRINGRQRREACEIGGRGPFGFGPV